MDDMADDSLLLDKLDPERDYGDRTFTEVQEQVRTGVLKLEEGATLPVIRETATNLVVKGTGRPAGKGAHAAFSRAYVQEKFADNAEAIWDAIMTGIREGDPRWAKLALEYGIGAPLQDKGNEAMADDFLKVLAALAERKAAQPDADYIEVTAREV